MIREISIKWCIEDIDFVLNDMMSNPPKLSEQDKSNILQTIKNRHDASVGINWEVIECHIDMYERK